MQNEYINPELLWSPDTLKEHIDNPNLRIIDVRPGERFAMGHIPGARHFDIYGVNCYDTDPAPVTSFVRMWAFLLGRRGVTHENALVFCGEITGQTAARGFWLAEYLGFQEVHVLDGGFSAWNAAGLTVTRDANPPDPKGLTYTERPELLATYRHVLDAIENPNVVILDTRSEGEYLGTDVRASRGGAVPQAVHQDWQNHLDSAGKMKSADKLRSQFEQIGVTQDKQIIAYCNTGYRSAHAYLALRLLGYPNVRNYLGSWQEWATREELPVEIP